MSGSFKVSDSDGTVTNVYALNSPGGFSNTGTNWSFNPAGFVGTTLVAFYAVDDLGARSTTNTLELITTNRPPVAYGLSNQVPAEVTSPLTLSGTDPDGDGLSFAISTGPGQGNLSGTSGNRVYQSANNFYGADSFTFTVSDGTDVSLPATVVLSVVAWNRPPYFTSIQPAGQNVSLSGMVQPNRLVRLAGRSDLGGGGWSVVSTQNIAWSTNLFVPLNLPVPVGTNQNRFFRLESLAP